MLLRGNLPRTAVVPFPFLPLFPLFLTSSEIFSFPFKLVIHFLKNGWGLKMGFIANSFSSYLVHCIPKMEMS